MCWVHTAPLSLYFKRKIHIVSRVVAKKGGENLDLCHQRKLNARTYGKLMSRIRIDWVFRVEERRDLKTDMPFTVLHSPTAGKL